MLRPIIAAATALALAACSAAPDRQGRLLRPVAEPSAVIAAEIAFARMAREKGTWTAFRHYATRDAHWPRQGPGPGPQWQSVQDSLKGQADPAQAIVWAPDMVWASCDGSFALSTGPATYPSGRRSRFTTIWQRQNDGEYRWVTDQGFDLEEGYTEREMIAARVADCPPRSAAGRETKLARARRGESWRSNASDDRTLAWDIELRADCSRTLSVKALQGGVMSEVFRGVSSPPVVPAVGAPPTC